MTTERHERPAFADPEPWPTNTLHIIAVEKPKANHGPSMMEIAREEAGEAPGHLTRQSRAAWYFAELSGHKVRFDHGHGRWLIWSKHYWKPDENANVERLWLDTLAQRYHDALREPGQNRDEKIKEVQTAGAMNSAIQAGLDIAKSLPPISTSPDEWDQRPWLLGCENGVVDLLTGSLRDGKPEDMISRSTRIKYDPTAACPRWNQFLEEVFAGDKELVEWYSLLIGSSLPGIAQEILAIHHGKGNNGKSEAVKALRLAFGDYATVIPIETLMSAKRAAGEATPDLMKLRGARLAFTSEPDQTAKLKGGVLKRLASIDQMTGRSLYGDTQVWEPTHTLQLATNHLPAADDTTEGFWRRIALIPWNVHFRKEGEEGTDPPEDPNVRATLKDEAQGILAWAVRYAVLFAERQTIYPFPESVKAKTQAYRDQEDKLSGFVEKRVVYETGATVRTTALFNAYREWAEAENLHPREQMGRTNFLNAFEERPGGAVRGRDNANNAQFTGARLRLPADEIGQQQPFSVF